MHLERYGRSIAPIRGMKTQHARVVLSALALVAAGTVSVIAQQAGITAVPRTLATARTTVSQTAVSKLKTDAFSTIQGNALNSTNGALNEAIVRLRDARFGRIVATQTTDKSGLFEFKAVDPGAYIVEVMANDQSAVLAASQLLNINSGEAVSAVVKLPFRIPPFAGIFGTSNTASAAAVASEAVASGVTSLVPTAPVSPTQ
jgi:hypothetical protein